MHSSGDATANAGSRGSVSWNILRESLYTYTRNYTSYVYLQDVSCTMYLYVNIFLSSSARSLPAIQEQA